MALQERRRLKINFTQFGEEKNVFYTELEKINNHKSLLKLFYSNKYRISYFLEQIYDKSLLFSGQNTLKKVIILLEMIHSLSYTDLVQKAWSPTVFRPKNGKTLQVVEAPYGYFAYKSYYFACSYQKIDLNRSRH